MRGARKRRRADQDSGGDEDGNGSGKSCDGMVLITAIVHRRHGILPYFLLRFFRLGAVNSGKVRESIAGGRHVLAGAATAPQIAVIARESGRPSKHRRWCLLVPRFRGDDI